jgi:hypothetical protein
MGRLIDSDDLVDASDAALELGYTCSETFHALVRRRPDFPKPVVNKGKGKARLWSMTDIRAWETKNGRIGHLDMEE